MSDYDLYRSRMSAYGNTIQEGRLNAMINKIKSTFEDSPSYFEVTINDVAQGVQILDENAITKNPNKKRVLCKPDEDINIGDDIVWNSMHWLCTNIDSDKSIYAKGIIEKCNNTLNFYKNQTLHTLPCIFTDISIDLHEGKFMNLPIGHYLIYISAGTITKSDMNLRFLLNDSAYKIEGISNATNGIVKIEVKDDKIIADDNEELGVANWFSNQNIYDILILNGEEVTLYGGDISTLQLNIQCKLNNEIIINPTVTYTSSNINCCSVNTTGLVTIEGTGSSIITVTYGNATDTIIITSLMSVEDNFEVIITPSDTEMYINKTKTFIASVTNNGVNMPYHGITWELVNVDGSSNVYCTYVVDGRNITITSKNTINKAIKIKAILTDDITVFEEQVITIKSLV